MRNLLVKMNWVEKSMAKILLTEQQVQLKTISECEDTSVQRLHAA